jgi:hypothetical protein
MIYLLVNAAIDVEHVLPMVEIVMVTLHAGLHEQLG